MTKSEIWEKLAEAQNLLDEVYGFACSDSSFGDLERAVSMADTCIVEAFELVAKMKE